MADHRNRLEDLDRRRSEFEGNVSKLRASLLHWQAWEIEYEGLKEEILGLGEAPTPSDIQKLADHDEVGLGDTSESLLTRKEKLNVFRDEKGVVRDRTQILNLLSRRIDYVQQNVKTCTSLLKSAEEKLVSTEVLREAKALNEEGLPLTEIHEELDEDGNIVSSSTFLPGQREAEAVDAIKQAANDLDIRGDGTKQQREPVLNGTSRAMPEKQNPKILETTHKSSARKPGSPKKSVSFVSDVQDESTADNASYHKAREQDLLNEISDREADEFERKAMAEAVIPEGETPEDAALRRQMIQYNMEEVGAVVAEIDLEDDANSTSEYDSETFLENFDDTEMEDDENEQEDEFGRTSNQKPLDEAYVKRMQALSDRLKAEPMINLGPDHPKEAKMRSTTREPAAHPKKTNDIPTKKGVRFAEDLDIQESPEVSVANLLAASSAMTGTPIAAPPSFKQGASLNGSMEDNDPEPKKMSKFKAARAKAATNASIANTFNSNPHSKAPGSAKPPPKILADTLVERPFTGSKVTSSGPDEPDDLDPGLLKNQVSTEYHRLRTRQIQREGGFVRNSEDQAEVQLAEEEGGPKKMSRFKAARLGLQ